jgi:hypothetical protein
VVGENPGAFAVIAVADSSVLIALSSIGEI